MAGVALSAALGTGRVVERKRKAGSSPQPAVEQRTSTPLTQIERRGALVETSHINPWEVIEKTNHVFFPSIFFSPGGHSASASQGMFQYSQ